MKRETYIISLSPTQGESGNLNGGRFSRFGRFGAGGFILLLLGLVGIFFTLHKGQGLGVGENGKGWDGGKMARLQPILLEQVKSLMLTANRSIHDPNARQILRNLSKEDSSACYTPNCLHTSLSFLESMNFSVDPCDDFYEFACGSWTHGLEAEELVALPLVLNSDQFSKINEKVTRATQRILEERSTNNSSSTFQQAQKLYRQCKDLDELERDGLSALWELMDKYGGWPLLGAGIQWNNSFDWLKLAGDLQRISSSAILSLEVKQHPINPLINTIYIVQPKFFLSKEYLISPNKWPKIFSAYKQFAMSLADEFLKYASVFGLNTTTNRTKLAEDIEEMIHFEIKLAKLAGDEFEGKTTRKAQFSIKLLQKEAEFMTPKRPKYPSNKISWLKFLNQVFSSTFVQLTEDERLFASDVSYVRGLTPLLLTTTPTTVANYLLWRLFVTFTTGTTHALRRLNFNFYNVVYGMKRIPSRASTCATVVKDGYSLALGSQIVKDVTDLSSKGEVEEMVEHVRLGMEQLLSNKALGPALFPLGISRKLNTLKHCIGYPGSFHNGSAVQHFYEDLQFGEDEDFYLKKYMKMRFWLFDKTLISLRQPFDGDCWSGISWANIGEAYAYYDTARNSINFPIGLLQPPFYRHNVPLSINFGGIGAIIGHEISHSVNIEGWIKVGLVKSLEEYWSCLESHYSSYHVPSLGPNSRVNGLRTRSENLADHLGLAAAYAAYQKLLEVGTGSGAEDGAGVNFQIQNEYERKLAGLDIFNQRQLFFISFAHMWCVNGPDEWLADELESSSHTPGRYRVLGSLQNSDGFAKTFSCPSGSKMNPHKKCNSFITSSQQ